MDADVRGSRAWRNRLDRFLMDSGPEALPAGMLWNLATGIQPVLSRSSFDRWLQDACASGRLRPVRKGLYLNAMGNKAVSPAAAATYVRFMAIPSLSWVLEQDWLLNNFSDVITCVVPMSPGMTAPSLRSVRTAVGEFRFRAVPRRIHELGPEVDVADWRDLRYAHPRATPEKALCDWLYLAGSPRSSMVWPPLDLEVQRMDMPRLKRLAKAMGLRQALDDWLAAKTVHDNDPEVVEGAPVRGGRKQSAPTEA